MKLITILIILACACARTDPAAAPAAAADYIKHIPGATGYECAATDSDGDGYCSCTVFRGSDEPMQIQCGCERICIWNCARGCKYVPSVKIQGGRRGAVE